MRGYNVYSFFQATEMAWVSSNGREWLITLDRGLISEVSAYNNYQDWQRARLLIENAAIVTTDSELDAALRDDNELGNITLY